MSENLFCNGLSKPGKQYRDGWTRTFKGYPEIEHEVLKMLHELSKEGDVGAVFLFFSMTKGLDDDYAAFLTREVFGGLL